MELVEGGTLADRLATQPLPPREAARLVQTLARAVHAVHRQGIVHRDLKPANILLQTTEDTEHTEKKHKKVSAGEMTGSSSVCSVSSVVPKITDFGLVKFVDGEGGQTQSDTVLGTASYMAPEQARGRVNETGPAADVYALGAILYETLTGRPPFQGPTRQEILAQVLEKEPQPPARLHRGLSRDLEAVCLKCLAKDPHRRYADAAALADDLERFLQGKPTRARPVGLWGRAARWVRRRPWLAAAPVFLGLAVWAGVGFFPDPHPDADKDPTSGKSPDTGKKPPSEKKRDALAEVQKELRRRRAVTLIPATGHPRWVRWRSNPATPLRDQSKPFSFRALDLTLAELLPSVPNRAFRFTAEVSHLRDVADGAGEAGIYLGYGRRNTPQGIQHSFLKFGFNDIKDVDKQHPVGKLKGNQAKLEAVLGYEKANERITMKKLPVGLDVMFRPAGLPRPRQWRKLSVEVRRGSVWIRWAKRKPVGPLSRAKLNQWTGILIMLSRVPGKRKPRFGLTAGLGIYLMDGEAAFRNAKVEPLDDTN
jgi:serine/threonine protein kinase